MMGPARWSPQPRAGKGPCRCRAGYRAGARTGRPGWVPSGLPIPWEPAGRAETTHGCRLGKRHPCVSVTRPPRGWAATTSVPRVLRQLRVRVDRPLRDREDRTVIPVRLVVEPRLRGEDAEADQVLPPVTLRGELPTELVEEAAVLDVGAAVHDRRAARA